jgi:hypothetical protein
MIVYRGVSYDISEAIHVSVLSVSYELNALLVLLKSLKRDFQKINFEQRSLTTDSDYRVLLFFMSYGFIPLRRSIVYSDQTFETSAGSNINITLYGKSFQKL